MINPVVASRVTFELVGQVNNEDLATCPHLPFFDMQIVFRFCVDPIDRKQDITITNTCSQLWELSTEDLLKLAKENTPRLIPAKITSLADILEDETAPIVYVLRSSRCSYGATSLLDDGAVASFADSLRSNLIIIPASVHECFIFPSGGIAIDVLKRSIDEANRSLLAPTEYLSDSVFLFSRSSNKLQLIP